MNKKKLKYLRKKTQSHNQGREQLYQKQDDIRKLQKLKQHIRNVGKEKKIQQSIKERTINDTIEDKIMYWEQRKWLQLYELTLR